MKPATFRAVRAVQLGLLITFGMAVSIAVLLGLVAIVWGGARSHVGDSVPPVAVHAAAVYQAVAVVAFFGVVGTVVSAVRAYRGPSARQLAARDMPVRRWGVDE